MSDFERLPELLFKQISNTQLFGGVLALTDDGTLVVISQSHKHPDGVVVRAVPVFQVKHNS